MAFREDTAARLARGLVSAGACRRLKRHLHGVKCTARQTLRCVGWVSSYQAIRAGSLEAVSEHVRKLTGRDPISLEAYLRMNPTDLDHVTARL